MSNPAYIAKELSDLKSQLKEFIPTPVSAPLQIDNFSMMTDHTKLKCMVRFFQLFYAHLLDDLTHLNLLCVEFLMGTVNLILQSKVTFVPCCQCKNDQVDNRTRTLHLFKCCICYDGIIFCVCTKGRLRRIQTGKDRM